MADKKGTRCDRVYCVYFITPAPFKVSSTLLSGKKEMLTIIIVAQCVHIYVDIYCFKNN